MSTCRSKEVAVSNPNHYTQSEGRRMERNENDIEMDSNPAYASCGTEYAVPGYTGVECTEDQGEALHESIAGVCCSQPRDSAHTHTHTQTNLYENKHTHQQIQCSIYSMQ